MSCPVGIPDPVVGIKGGFILMELAIERAEIATVFADINRPFKATVKRRVEHGFIGFAAAFHPDSAKYLVPLRAASACDSLEIIVFNFSAEILFSLFFADKRHTIPQVNSLLIAPES